MRSLNYRTRFIELAGEINSEMPEYWVEKVVSALNDLGKPAKGSTVLVVGVAYKKDVDDLRESPALDIVRLLQRLGAVIRYHDPFIPELREDGMTLKSVPLTAETVRGADCVVIVTDHSKLDYAMLAREARALVDTRHAVASRARAK
jgi:UDP-N-acetyl-D-glucosamine dehydrogenase